MDRGLLSHAGKMGQNFRVVEGSTLGWITVV